MATPVDVRLIANLTSPDWWTIGSTAASTIVGAIIGAVIAYIIAKQTATESRKSLKAELRSSEEAATLRAETKLIQLTNAVAGYHQGIEQCIKDGKAKLGEHFQLWSAMKSFVGGSTNIPFDVDDMIAFMRAREFRFVSKFILLLSRFNSLESGLDAYRQERDKLLAMLTPQQMDGLFGMVHLTEQEKRQLAPHIAAVNDLAEQVRVHVKDVFDLALEVTNQFGPIARRYFDDPEFPIPAPVKAPPHI